MHLLLCISTAVPLRGSRLLACVVAEKGVVLRPVCSTSVHNFLAKIQGPKLGDSYLTVPAKTLHPAQKNQQPKHHHKKTAKQWGGFRPLAKNESMMSHAKTSGFVRSSKTAPLWQTAAISEMARASTGKESSKSSWQMLQQLCDGGSNQRFASVICRRPVKTQPLNNPVMHLGGLGLKQAAENHHKV